jgi:outer membrane lipoprotein SlyB
MPTTDNTSTSPAAATGFGHVPRAVWVAGGALALAAAGMAGALIGKSTTPPAASLTAPVATAAPSPPPGNLAYSPVPQDGVPTPTNTVTATAPPVAPVPAPAKAANPTPAPARAAAGTRAADARPTIRAAACLSCGKVESVEPVRVKGQGTGIGAVAGGVLGGVVGHQIGGGSGKTAMTVLGALGGGLAGNEVERRTRGETLYDVQVRMQDGSHRSIRQGQALAVGSAVVVEGGRVRLARRSSGDGVRTSG